MKQKDRKTMDRFIRSHGPGEYIFSTCASRTVGFSLDRATGGGKSGWKKEKWVRRFLLDLSEIDTKHNGGEKE